MADITYDSAGSGSYTALLSAISAVTASDDTILALSTSNETTANSSQTYAASATYATPEKLQKLLSVNGFSTPAISSGATITCGGSSAIQQFTGNWVIDGIKLYFSGSTSNTLVSLGNSTASGTIVCNNVSFEIRNTSVSGRLLNLGPASGSGSNDTYRNELNNCSFYFGNAASFIRIGAGNHFINGFSTISGSTVVNNLFSSSAGTGLSNLYFSNADLSGYACGAILDGPSLGQNKIFLSRIKLNASTAFFSGAMSQHNELTAVNCHTGDSHISFYYASYSGNVINDSTVYATTNPLQDAGTSISRKMTTTATAGRGAPLQTEVLLPVANDATVTPYVEILVGADGAAALTDLECWIDVSAITTDGTTIGTTYTTHPGILASGTNLLAGTTSYTGDGYATERTHKIALASSITVRQDSFIKITVNLAKPSTVIYVGSYGG